MLLRPLGHGYWGVEQTEDGFSLFGKGGKRLAFSELAGSPKETKALGFQAACFPLKSGADVKIVGLKSNAIAKLIASARTAMHSYYGAIIDEAEQEFQSLVKAIARLEDPRRYPSACLLDPFWKRATALLGKLPEGMPEDALAEDKKKL